MSRVMNSVIKSLYLYLSRRTSKKKKMKRNKSTLKSKIKNQKKKLKIENWYWKQVDIYILIRLFRFFFFFSILLTERVFCVYNVIKLKTCIRLNKIWTKRSNKKHRKKKKMIRLKNRCIGNSKICVFEIKQ